MKNYFDIKDKVAVITGGSSGLGFKSVKHMLTKVLKSFS